MNEPSDRTCNGFRALWSVGKATPRRLVALVSRDVDELLSLQAWAGERSFFNSLGDNASEELYRTISESIALALDERRPSWRQGMPSRLYVVTRPRMPQWVISYDQRPVPSVKTEMELTSTEVPTLRIKIDRVVLKDNADRAVMYGHVVEPAGGPGVRMALRWHGFTERVT